MQWLPDIFHWVVQTSIMASVLTGIILLIKRMVKERLGTSLHYYIWVVLMIRLLLPYAPESDISVFNLFNPALQSISFNNSSSNKHEPGSTDTTNPVLDGHGLPASGEQPEGYTAPQKTVSLFPGTHQTPDTVHMSTEFIVSAIWLGGSILFILYILAIHIRLHIKIRKNSFENSEKINRLFDECKSSINARLDTCPVLTSAIRTPSLFGMFKPRVLIPYGLVEEVSEEELQHIFMHELVHFKRRDYILNWLITFLCALHWFNPVIWYGFKRMRQDCEVACDARVIWDMAHEERLSYGYTMIHLLKVIKKPQWIPGTTGMIEKNQLKRRIAMISSLKKPSVILSIIAAIIIVLVAVIGLTNAKRENTTDTKTQAGLSTDKSSTVDNNDNKKGTDEKTGGSGDQKQGTSPEKSTVSGSDTDKVLYYIGKLQDKTFTSTYGEGYTWYTAAEELGQIGKPAIPYLIKKLDTQDDYERTLAFYALLLASQHENVKAFTKDEYIETSLEFDAKKHTEMKKTALLWWEKYKSHFESTEATLQSGEGPKEPGVENGTLEVKRNIFDGKKAVIGNIVAGMEIVSMDTPNNGDSEVSTFTGEFSGKAVVSGQFVQYQGDEFLGDLLTFKVDEKSQDLLPKLKNDTRYLWFAFKNQDEAKNMYKQIFKGNKEGAAKVEIENYTIHYEPSDVYNEAKLIRILQ